MSGTSRKPKVRNPVNYFGPYENWMYGPGRDYDFPALAFGDFDYLSCVAEHLDWQTLFTGAPKINRSSTDSKKQFLLFPELWSPDGFEPTFVPFALSAPPGSQSTDISAINKRLDRALSDARSDANFRMNFPFRPETFDPSFRISGTTDRSTADKSVNPQKGIVVVAIIDDGIPFAHRNFRHPGSARTRIDYCWSQSATSEGNGRILFGREFNRTEIDKLVKDHDGDEDAIYRSCGLLGSPERTPMPLDLMYSHGSHVLDSLAGEWPDDQAAQVRIIAVDLPATSTWDTSGFGKDMYVISALHYIFNRADAIAAQYGKQALPLVINLSYGFSGGSHDGDGLVEAAMDELIRHRREKYGATAIVMPSGNLFVDALHSVAVDQHFGPTGKSQTNPVGFQWFVQPDDRTSSYLELWLPKGVGYADYDIAVYAPESSVRLNKPIKRKDPEIFGNSKVRNQPIMIDKKVVGQFSIEHYRGGRWRAAVILAPTLPSKAGLPAAPAGTWTIKVVKAKPDVPLPATTANRGNKLAAGGIQCWIQRDTEFGQGDTGARQSMFRDPKNETYGKFGDLKPVDSVSDLMQFQPMPQHAFVRRFGSLNGMATGKETIVVAGYDESNRCAVIYSSAGPLRYKSRKLVVPGKQVDVSAVTDRSQWAQGIVGAGTRSGIVVALSGTSSAAPQVARRLAEEFFLRNPGSGKQTDKYKYLELLEAQEPIEVDKYPRAGPHSVERLGKLMIRRPRPVNRDEEEMIQGRSPKRR